MQTDKVSETPFYVENSLPDDGKPTKNQAVLIISIFIIYPAFPS
jgi:hypothetical protein